MEEKKVIIKFHNGFVYEVPAMFIAENRADYYATEVEGFPKGSDGYIAERNLALDDPDELFDWMYNNMNWDEILPHARLIQTIEPNLDEEWMEGNTTLSVNW
jgi:hypothetical protein